MKNETTALYEMNVEFDSWGFELTFAEVKENAESFGYTNVRAWADVIEAENADGKTETIAKQSK